MLDSSLTDIKNSVQVFLTGGVSSTDTQVIKQVANAKINPNVPVPSLPPFIKNLLPGGNS
jgi:hypothetical protein